MSAQSPNFAEYVAHPRFGKGPRLTGLNPTQALDGSVWLHFHTRDPDRVPNTAIVANTARQNRPTIPVTHYFDVRRRCRACGRPFLFFAEEQQYWYEELQFPLEADCVRCVECRAGVRELRAMKQQYDLLLQAPRRSAEDTLELVGAAYALVEASIFSPKVVPRMRALLRALQAGENPQVAVRAQELLAFSPAPQ